MTRFTVVSGVFLSLVLGAALSAVAQDEHPSERPPNAPQEPKETRPEPTQRPEQPQQPEQARPQDRQEQQHPQQQARPDDRRNQEPESGNRKNTTPQSEGKQPQDQQSGDRHMQGREHENEQQQAGVKHEGQQRRISDTDFHEHFGREHHFAPRVLQPYQGKPSFAYGGYTFVLVEAWPSQWVYDDDDYYIDYIDGEYWMYNVLYPGARVELIIVE